LKVNAHVEWHTFRADFISPSPTRSLGGENSLSAFYAHVQQWGNLYEHICRIKCPTFGPTGGKELRPGCNGSSSRGRSQLVVAGN